VIRTRSRQQAGFTLVEVMVSLVVSAILVGMILAIWSRLSLAYRGQQSVSELQQILSAGHELMETDLKQAGFQLPDGFFMANTNQLVQPVEIIDNASGFGPDELRIYAADASAVARVVDFNGAADSATAAFTVVEVDSTADFVPGDVAVIVKAQSGLPEEIAFFPCVVGISGVNGTQLQLATAPPWGSASNDQCDQVRTDTALGPDNRAMVYRFSARAYRIDANRRDLAILQVSRTAGFVNDWEDLGVGFTDLQVASWWDDTDDNSGMNTTDTPDVDNDPTREWWSNGNQTTMTNPLAATIPLPPTNLPVPYVMGSYDMTRPRLVAVRVSLVVRTHSRLDVVPTARTPVLTDTARTSNNDLGNRDYVQLEGVADAARPQELRGDHIYRYATVGSDLRNMGVGL
jgi:prepilin-type N-terminal cleavage/methylation domain-containing protein